MRKNVFKVGVLAAGLFGFGLLLSNAKAAVGDVSLTINAGTSVCTYGTSLNLGSAPAVIGIPYSFTGSFTGTTFECTDYRGTDVSWYMGISSSDLGAAGLTGKIGSGNVKVFYEGAIASGNKAACTGSSAGVVEINAIPLSGTVTLLQRLPGQEGVCSVALGSVSLKVDVPANQAPGTYTGTLTLTIPSF